MDSLDLNRASWDERAAIHVASPDYAVDRLVADPAALSDVVRFDRPQLGDIDGLRGVHLQCHVGTDTLSLARLGAEMTGLDFSPASLEQARHLAERAGACITFVEADVYSALDVLAPASFDFVYTGIGALCWLPDVARWGDVVGRLLRPGGWLLVRDAHPALQSVDELGAQLVVEHPYFTHDAPEVVESDETYVETDARLVSTVTHQWTHGLAEIVTAVLSAGMRLDRLAEHDSVPWPALPGCMRRDATGEWRLVDRPYRLPLTFTLRATRVAS